MSMYRREHLPFDRNCGTHLSWELLLDTIQGMEASSSPEQFGFLADATAEVLDKQCLRDYHGYQAQDRPALTSFLQDLRSYIETQKTYNPLNLVLNRAQQLETIDDFYGRLTTVTDNEIQEYHDCFGQASRLTIDFSVWKSAFDNTRKRDQEALDEYWEKLTMDQKSMVQAVGFNGTNAIPILVDLHRCLNEITRDEEEIRYINTAISHLSTSQGLDLTIGRWTIKAPEVDIGQLIGTGSMGKVFRGKWNHKDVVIKMLKTGNNITPRLAYISREMERWSKLHHPHVLPFLGGNNLDDEPFIVSPFLRHRTCRDYLQKRPDCDRLRLLYETLLGLLYLHSEKIIHGNVKGLNILVDDTGKPQLCDYGLGKLKADVNSRSPAEPVSSPFWGSQNWMAPELLLGDHLTFRCDTYSFGMTMYEIFADDVPLGYVPLDRLYNLVVERNIRPSRPEATQLSDAVWRLAEQCWVTVPTHRIELSTLSEKLAALLPPHVPAAGDSMNVPPRVSQPTGLRQETIDGLA